MSQPVKRGPGRPRKNPLPEAATAPEAKVAEPKPTEPAAAESDESPPPKPKPSNDLRIGMEVHPDATAVGFDDGVQYLAEGGFITERVG